MQTLKQLKDQIILYEICMKRTQNVSEEEKKWKKYTNQKDIWKKKRAEKDESHAFNLFNKSPKKALYG